MGCTNNLSEMAEKCNRFNDFLKVTFQSKIYNISWFQLFSHEGLLLFFVISDRNAHYIATLGQNKSLMALT